MSQLHPSSGNWDFHPSDKNHLVDNETKQVLVYDATSEFDAEFILWWYHNFDKIKTSIDTLLSEIEALQSEQADLRTSLENVKANFWTEGRKAKEASKAVSESIEIMAGILNTGDLFAQQGATEKALNFIADHTPKVNIYETPTEGIEQRTQNDEVSGKDELGIV